MNNCIDETTCKQYQAELDAYDDWDRVKKYNKTWRRQQLIGELERKIEHHLNPLHVYCRLRDIKIPKSYAMRLCMLYEKNLYGPLKGKISEVFFPYLLMHYKNESKQRKT